MKRSKIEMLDLVAQYQNGNLTQGVFAAQHGISKATLCYWIKKQQTSDNGSFIGITSHTLRKSEPKLPQIELDFPNGVTLRIGSTNLSLIASLIRLV